MLVDMFLSLMVRLVEGIFNALNSWDIGPIGVMRDMSRGFYQFLSQESVGGILGLIDTGMLHTVSVYMLALLPVVVLVRLAVTAVGALMPGGIS